MPRKPLVPPSHEWSYLVEASKIESDGNSFSFKADERQRNDLAHRLGLVEIGSAEAQVTLQRVSGRIIHAIGTFQADITQSCVVTLRPVQASVQDDFEGWFGEKGGAVSFAKAKSERDARKGHTEAEILEESVDPEPIVDGYIDIGELATQYLSLSIDPYPHAPGASREFVVEPPLGQQDGKSLRKNPFEALKDWKEKR